MIRPEHKFVAIPPTVKIFFAVLFSGAGRRGGRPTVLHIIKTARAEKPNQLNNPDFQN